MAASPYETGAEYGSNVDGDNATIGATTQINPAYFYKKALIEIVKERYFGQLADVRAMPKNMGKTIKQHHYLPMLDDANLNDQGLDGASVTTLTGEWHAFYTDGTLEPNVLVTDAVMAGNAAGYATKATGDAIAAFDPATMRISQGAGQLYGSSKDVGTITSRMPALTEHGGRVNRVGFTRTTISATLEKYGFFDEYTQESLDFDTDADLLMHITRETLRGANEIVEDLLQRDLLGAAGVVAYSGDATTRAELTGATTIDDVLTYTDLLKLSITLDNNRCPKSTTIISGSRSIDTKIIGAARYIYCGSELLEVLEGMEDLHSNKAFVPVEQYAHAGGTKEGSGVATGEVGSIGHFRVIVVPEMMHYAGEGAVEGTNSTPPYAVSTLNEAVHYDVHPMLVVGSGSFTTVGFQTNGKTVKFKITHKKPGKDTADRHDPYGETGFYSIKWYYAFMALRPEWIARLETIAIA
jgi:N4-gp56 family major capsid protein